MTIAPSPRPVTPVGILAAELERLSQEMERLSREVVGLDPAIAADLRHAAALAAGLDPYLGACTTAESPALAALAARTRSEEWGRRGDSAVLLEQEMLSGHVEGRLLNLLVHATGARRVLEIGMFTGYSALAMAEALPVDGVVVACELDAHAAGIAQECFDVTPAGARIEVLVGPAAATLRRLADAGESFDLVFVDADKAGYLGYLEQLLDSTLLAPNGLVCVDNTLLQGLPYLPGEPTGNGRAVRDFNAAVADDPRVEQVLIPLRDGLTLIRRV